MVMHTITAILAIANVIAAVDDDVVNLFCKDSDDSELGDQSDGHKGRQCLSCIT